MTQSLLSARMHASADFRVGIVLPPQTAPKTYCDPPVYSVAIPHDSGGDWRSASGGVARDEESATLCAIGEALERYSAQLSFPPRANGTDKITLSEFTLFSPEQVASKTFPYKEILTHEQYVEAYRLHDNTPIVAPEILITLNQAANPLTTSSGLAVASTPQLALLRAVEELLERDALMATWLHSLCGTRIVLDEKYQKEVTALHGEVFVVDATQVWNPFKVAIVAGFIPQNGKRRYSLGAACRETWEEAVEKAYLEWTQGVTFAGLYCEHNTPVKERALVRTFDDHAAYYTARPDEWKHVALGTGPTQPKPTSRPKHTISDELSILNTALKEAGIEIFYRDLTSRDVAQIGLSCIRAISPQLIPIHFDERAPFLGGTAPNYAWRYPGAAQGKFPNPLPHPLG